MNSRQRRRQLREYRYSVVTEHDEYQSYMEAWEWLSDNFGQGRLEKKHNGPGWFERFDVHNVKIESASQSPWYFKVRWYFKNRATAVEFALRWS